MITENDLNTISGGHHRIVATNDFPGVIAGIEDILVRFSEWGMNPKDVRAHDFDLLFILVFADQKGKVGIPPHPYLIAKSLTSGRFIDLDVAVMQEFGYYPVASTLMQLTEKQEEV